MNSDGLPPLRDVIRKHDLAAKKSLGQNFILDLNLTGKIARIAGPLEGYSVVEVGPGPGGLTRAILTEGADTLFAIERDARCLAALAEIADAYPGRLTIENADALEIDYTDRITNPTRIIANLPYSVATPLLIGWLTPETWPSWWTSMTLMFQREVAERIVATPGTKAYGRLAVLAQWRAHAKIAMTLPPGAFTPPPKVESSVVLFTPRDTPIPITSVRHLERVTAAAFGQRRKMLRASLKQISRDAEAIIASCEIDPRKRAEDLDVSAFCALANAFATT